VKPHAAASGLVLGVSQSAPLVPAALNLTRASHLFTPRCLPKTDWHSLPRKRVNAIFVTAPEPARTLHCRAGDASFQDPVEVCRLR
jgi:hypothetical protein